MDEEQFNFVIARPWVEGESSLCVYAYGTEVFHGTIEQARGHKNFINRRCEPENKGKYKIYKINPTPIE